MKYDFTIQPNPVKIQGIEAASDVEAQGKLRKMMEEQADSILDAVRKSRWTVTLVQQYETYMPTSTEDLGVASTAQSEAKLDDALEENLFE